ncbi:hypothetical protein GCM10027272_22130 [Hymenobacter frigidus]
MNRLPLLLLFLLTAACQSQPDRPTEPAAPAASSVPTAPKRDTASPVAPSGSPATLALADNAVQLVNAKTGSTTTIPLGRPFDPLVRTITNALGEPPARVGVNGECGAGPLKMATWANGLTLAFQAQNRGDASPGREWQFAGWSLNPGRGAGRPPATMAGVSLGTTRAEVESAYVIKVVQSSLGYEFSTASGLYGLFDGAGPQARVSALWSGTSCVFR